MSRKLYEKCGTEDTTYKCSPIIADYFTRDCKRNYCYKVSKGWTLH